jgi:hypothetical protein
MNLEEFLSPELIELYVIPWAIRVVMALRMTCYAADSC